MRNCCTLYCIGVGVGKLFYFVWELTSRFLYFVWTRLFYRVSLIYFVDLIVSFTLGWLTLYGDR